jgi:hypothetical protein
MGIFDTPAIVNESILKLRSKPIDQYRIHVNIENDENLFHVTHDYFDSPCYFRVISWIMDPKGNPVFNVECFPHDSNNLKTRSLNIPAANVDKLLYNWEIFVDQLISYEELYIDPSLNTLRKELMLKLGLTEENADQILDETQKNHACQFCDQIVDILNELNDKDYDSIKIREIKFDLEKIKRDIENLRIKTNKELMTGIANAWGKVNLAKVGKYILDKAADGVAGKLIGEIIDKIG